MIEEFLHQIMETILGWLPENLHNPFVYFLCAGAGLLALILALGLVWRILRIRWQAPVVQRVRLQNAGNVPGYFWLGAFAPDHDLKFEYWLEGARLPVKTLAPKAAASAPAAHPVEDIVPAQAAAPQPAASPPTGARQNDAPAQGVKDGLGKADQKTRQALGIGQIISGILGALGALLPGSLGQPFRQAATDTQSKVQQVRVVTDKPGQTMRSVDSLKGQTANLQRSVGAAPQGGAGAPKPLPATAPAAPAQPGGVNERMHSQPAATLAAAEANVEIQAQAAGVDEQAAAHFKGTEYVELRALAPQEAFDIELRIRPLSQYRSAETAYWLLARQLIPAAMIAQQPAPEWLPAAQDMTQKMVQRFSVKGISQFYRLTTALLVLVVVELNLLWLLPVLRWLLQFVVAQ